jgi:hypothetical protein
MDMENGQVKPEDLGMTPEEFALYLSAEQSM